MKNNVYENLISRDFIEPIVIAEMSGNHQNSLEGAMNFINKISEQKPDIIKFQVYTPDTITLNVSKSDFLVDSNSSWSSHGTLYDLYKKAHTPWDWIQKMVETCDSIGLPWFASPFDSSSVEFLEELNCQAYKLASPEITDIGLIEKICVTGKPIIISTGVSTLTDLDLAIQIVRKHHNKYSILKCTSAYPTPHIDLNLKTIEFLKNRYKCKVGFSDHTIGDTAAIVAVSLGARIVEKHFKLDGDNKSIDSHFSKEISQLSNFKSTLIKASQSVGSKTLEISKSAKSGTTGRRSLYVCEPIKKGEVFSYYNIKSVRPSYGMHPKYLKKIIGKNSLKDLEIGDRVTKDSIEHF